MRIAEQMVGSKGGHMISVAADTMVYDALQTMVEHRIGAVLVHREEDIIGIWTERDLMRNTLIEGFDPKTARVGDYMITDLHMASHQDSVYQLMDMFLGLRVRHLPVKKDGEYIGLLSVGDVMKACLREKSDELAKLNALVSWEYHEEWQWDPKRSEEKVHAV